jgi:prepilin-type N-terminal cleavage/methylation domain-containing protein
MRRRAFTLIEVMVAIVVTGLVVALAYTAAQAGFDTEERTARVRTGSEADAVGRAMIGNALRHALPGIIGGDTVFALEAYRVNDRALVGLRFLTRGVIEPFGATGTWEVTVRPGSEGLRIEGRPVDSRDTAPITGTLPGVRAIEVRVRGRDARQGWLDAWVSPDRSPAAVAITFLDAAGQSTGAPLVARVGLEDNP